MSDDVSGRVVGRVADNPMCPERPQPPPDIAAEFDQWLRRLTNTHDALAYTCTYRIGDPVLAREVSFRVMSALLGKPQVFRHYGLPYSGRIARLAEPLIALARRGDLIAGPLEQWERVFRGILNMPIEVRHVVVVCHVLGNKGETLGALLGCDAATADRRRESAVAWMQAAARPPLDETTDPLTTP